MINWSTSLLYFFFVDSAKYREAKIKSFTDFFKKLTG